MTNDTYPVYKKGMNPKLPTLIILVLALCICLATCLSCTSVKKVQKSLTETFKIETVKSKDSGATVVKESTTKANENTEASKTITIEFNPSIDTPISFISNLPVDAWDYLKDSLEWVVKDRINKSQLSMGYFSNKPLHIVGKTRLITNKPAAVKIHANGDIELSEQPKSITVKENTSKQKSDSTHTKEAATTNVNEKETAVVVAEKKEVENKKSVFRFLSWWYLLALIPVAYLLNKKFNIYAHIKKITG